MKYEINGKVVEVEKELSEQEIDDIAGQLGGGQSAPTPQATEGSPTDPKFYEIEKQQGLPKGPLDMVKNIAKEFKAGIESPLPGSFLSTPVRLLQNAAGQAGADVARAAQPSIGTVPARAAGFGTSMALDPTSYVSAGMGARAAKSGLDAVAGPIGRQLAKGAEGMSNVPVKNIVKLFKDPAQVLKALSAKKTSPELNAAKRAMGVTPEDEFLIGRAADRTPGASRTVVDDIREKLKADFITQGINPKTIKPTDKPIALYIGRQDWGKGMPSEDMFNIYGNHPKNTSTVTKAQLDELGIPVMGRALGVKTSKQVPASFKNLTAGDLLALNRAAGKVAKESKGSEKVLYGRLKAAAVKEVQERSPRVAEALEKYALGKTKESFQSPFPLNKSGKADFFKTAAAPMVGFATSPMVVGAGTLAARGAYEAGKPVVAGAGALAGAAVNRQATNPQIDRVLGQNPLLAMLQRLRRLAPQQ